MVRNILFSLIALGTIIGNAFAQSADAGALFGTITESSGAVLPDTSVTITNLATKRTEVEKTNGSGFYSREAPPRNQGRPSRISMCPSRVCMQRRIKDSRAQPNGCRLRRVRMGCRKSEPAKRSEEH